MLFHNLKTSLRSLLKHQGFTLLNTIGLTLGLASITLIGVWARYELSYNRSFPKFERLAQVMQTQTFGGEMVTFQSQPWQTGSTLRQEYSNYFDKVVTATYNNETALLHEGTKLRVMGNWAEPEIAGLLGLEMIAGDQNGLSDPSSILISASLAESLFGKGPALNKTILVLGTFDLKVAGVYKDLPANSDFRNWKFIAPWKRLFDRQDYENELGWGNNWFQVYVRLAEGHNMASVSEKIKLLKQEREPDHDEAEMFLFPAKKWHLYSDFENGKSVGGRIAYVRIFLVIGGCILLLACVNFMNLSTAQAMKRAKEIGIRKTLGSNRKQLVQQFLTESFLIVILAFGLSLIVSILFLPYLNGIVGETLSLPWTEPNFWLLAIGVLLVTAVMASIYPAIYLSGFNPIATLKGKLVSAQHTGNLRKGLVVFQFSISILLLIGTITVTRQIQHVRERPVNYKQELIITVPISGPKMIRQFNSLRSNLLESPSIKEVAASDVRISNTQVTNGGFNWKGKPQNMNDAFYTLRSTFGFGKLVGWQIVEGRDFSREFKTDSNAALINETAVRYMGLENPIGAHITRGNYEDYHIIGVVKDMVTRSPFEPIDPALFTIHYDRFLKYVNIEVNGHQNLEEAINHAQMVFETYNPDNLFSYSFIDEAYQKNFTAEIRTARLIGSFSGIAILISCLGVLGLSLFMVEQKRKEIGVRKVLGASVSSIWQILTKQFIYLLGIAFLIAAPMAYYLAGNWLSSYAYRMNFDWWIIVVSGLLSLIIMLVVLSYHIVRSALRNPIEAIRTE